MLVGESGTGQVALARELHDLDGAGKPWVVFDCDSTDTAQLGIELFGRERSPMHGACERAGAGMLVLREIALLPYDLQDELARALRERNFRRVGSKLVRPLEARVIATTHCELDELVARRLFRRELVSVLTPIAIPPLRERTDPVDSERALLDAIVAAPEDDAPRSIYADLLSSRGDPRGELIALSLAGGEPRVDPIAGPVYELFSLGREWERAVARVEVARGFVSAVFARHSIGTVVRLLERLFAMAPVVDTLGAALRSDPPCLVSPLLRRIRRLRLELSPDGLHQVDTIAACPYLDRLHTLELAPSPNVSVALSPTRAAALAASPSLAGVRELVIDGVAIGAAAFELVGASVAWRLERLSVRAAGLDDALAEQLLTRPGAAWLRQLDWE